VGEPGHSGVQLNVWRGSNLHVAQGCRLFVKEMGVWVRRGRCLHVYRVNSGPVAVRGRGEAGGWCEGRANFEPHVEMPSRQALFF
jgi:hypothetical protein